MGCSPLQYIPLVLNLFINPFCFQVVAQLVELDSPPPAIVPVEKPNIKVISRRQDESDGTTTLAIVVPKSPFTYDQEK